VADPDTLVFVPAWNEEESLPAVLTELQETLPGADVVVIDDGSTDATAEVARAGGADVVSFGRNRGLVAAIAAGYAHAEQGGYAFCGRVDADGQHPADELARLLALVREDACDVAVGSRFASGDGYEAYRYKPTAARRLVHFALRRLVRFRLGRPMLDATSGMYAVNRKAMPLLARPYEAGAPEVEGLMRLAEAGLRVREVPVDMRERASGESKLQGKKAAMLVLTVAATVLAARRWRKS
jgi:glycosyltransferase involved in cell wall biosynthesis